jgi:hypothetical protein
MAEADCGTHMPDVILVLSARFDRSICSHDEELLHRLGVKNRTEAVMVVVKHDWL